MLLVAPVTLLVCDRLGVPPVPFLIAEAMASNIGGTATLIGDPPNIIIASRSGLTFNDFLVNLAPIIAVVLVVFLGLCRLLFRSAFAYDAERVAALMALDEREAIRDRAPAGPVRRRAGRWCWSASSPHSRAATSSRRGRAARRRRRWSRCPGSTPTEFLEEVEWPTLVFFMGLFVMVGALVEVGVIGRIGPAVADAVGGQLPARRRSALLWGSAALSGIVDNIPYVATMAPLVAGPGRRRRRRRPGARRCGGRWRSAPTSAATPPPSAPAPTSWSSASPPATGTRSRSGTSPSTASSSPSSPIAIAWAYFSLRYFAFA